MTYKKNITYQIEERYLLSLDHRFMEPTRQRKWSWALKDFTTKQEKYSKHDREIGTTRWDTTQQNILTSGQYSTKTTNY